MLDKDGWKLGADGVRAKNGVALTLRYGIYSGAPDVDESIELLRQNWQAIGVDLSVKHYSLSNFFALAKDGGILYDPSKWDVTSFAWRNDAIGDYSSAYGCHYPPDAQDFPHWCNQKAHAAIDALYTHYDQAQRNADVRRFVEPFVADVPVIVVNQRVNLYALNSDVKNFHPNSITPFDNFMDVDI
jgi:peptide/nickel transport system substrate-binding protein